MGSTKQCKMRIDQKMRGANSGNEMEASVRACGDYHSETADLFRVALHRVEQGP